MHKKEKLKALYRKAASTSLFLLNPRENNRSKPNDLLCVAAEEPKISKGGTMVTKVYGDIELMTANDIATKLQAHIVTIRRYIREGKLKAKKIGRRYYIPKESFRDFIDKA